MDKPAAPSWPGYLSALVIGLALWFAAAALIGRREPWDGPGYWSAAWPSAIALCGLLGWLFPQRPWRWALVLFWSQMLQMVLAGSGLGLWPLGLALLTVLALPGIALAKLASVWRLRQRGSAS